MIGCIKEPIINWLLLITRSIDIMDVYGQKSLPTVTGALLLFEHSSFADLLEFVASQHKVVKSGHIGASTNWEKQVPFYTSNLADRYVVSLKSEGYLCNLNPIRMDIVVEHPVLHGFLCSGNPNSGFRNPILHSEILAHQMQCDPNTTQANKDAYEAERRSFYRRIYDNTFGLKLYLWVDRPEGWFEAYPREIVIVHVTIRVANDYSSIELIKIRVESNKYWVGTHAAMTRSCRTDIKYSTAYGWRTENATPSASFSNDTDLTPSLVLKEMDVHQKIVEGLIKALIT